MHERLARELELYLGDERDRLPEAFLDALDATYRRAEAQGVKEERAKEGGTRGGANGETPGASSPDHLRATLEAAADGILVVDIEGRISGWNRRLLEMWGLGPEDMAEGTDQGLERVRALVREPAAFLDELRRLSADSDAESRNLLELVDSRVFEAISLPQEIDGRAVGRVWSFRDVSEHHQLEAQVRQSQKMEAVGRVAGSVAHDFNNLLTVIKGYCDLCERQLQEDEGPLARSLQQISKAAERAADMTGQLLAFSRQQKLEPAVVDLHEITLDFQPMMRRLIDEDVELGLELDAETPTVLADPGRLQQVLLNLVINARDALPKGGQIRLTTENIYLVPGPGSPFGDDLPTGNYVLVHVVDDGEGIPPEVRSQIFEPFFTTKDKGRGTGLGLATVYGIVKQSNGAITVESTPGEGTTFSIALPLAEPSDHPAEISPTIVDTPERRARILVVEDEEPVRLMLEALLEEQGHEVHSSASPHDALRDYGRAEPHFDLMVTDIVMPGMYGPDLADRLRTVRPGLRILYISGYDPAARERRGAPRAGGAFLQKPFDAATLERKIQEVLRSPPDAAPTAP